MEEFKLNLLLPQKAINQLIEDKINEIIDCINEKENNDKKKEEKYEKNIDTKE